MVSPLMINSPLSVSDKRYPMIGAGDIVAPGGAIALFDTGPKLHPAQSATFTGMLEGVSGRPMTYAAGSTTAATFTGGMWTIPSTTTGRPGFLAGAHTDDGIDLSAATETEFLINGWIKPSVAGSTFVKQLFFIGNDGASVSADVCQVLLSYAQQGASANNGLRLNIAGKEAQIGYAMTLDTVYFYAMRAVIDASSGITRIHAYRGTNVGGPEPIGVFNLPYAAFGALSSGGCSFGDNGSADAAGVVGPTGIGLGRTLFEAVPDNVSGEGRIFAEWEANKGRFS